MPSPIAPRLDGPVLSGEVAGICEMRLRLVITIDIELTPRAKVKGAKGVGAIAVRLDLPVLAREIAFASHLDEAFFVTGTVVDNVESVANKGVLQSVPGLAIEAPGWSDRLDGYVERHRRRGLRDSGHGYVRILTGIRFAIGVGCRIKGTIARSSGERITCITRSELGLELVETISLHELDFGVVFIGICEYGIVDVPD